MPSRSEEIRELVPTRPEGAIWNLLAFCRGEVLPLAPGDVRELQWEEGEYLLVAAVQGSATAASHEQYTLLSQGQALALSTPGVCTLQAVADCLCMAAVVRGEGAERLLEDRMEKGRALFAQGAAAVREAVLVLAVLEDEHGRIDGTLASSYAYTMLTALRNLPAGEGSGRLTSPLAESAVVLIQEEFPYLAGMDELAERLEVSKAHLIRTFTKAVGISPGKYLTRVRVEYAKLLLRDEDVSVTYAAEASGFANANYFAKVFRRETGMSPSEYLESAPVRPDRRNKPGNGPLPW